MGTKFSQSFKIRAVEKALTRQPGTKLVEVADDLQIGLSTLNQWIGLSRKQAFKPVKEVELMTDSKEKRPQDWSLEERLQMLIKCGGLGDTEISKICREHGIHLHHLKAWKEAFTDNKTPKKSQSKAELKALKNENKSLKKEVRRKDKALAETAALLILKKKVDAFRRDEEEED